MDLHLREGRGGRTGGKGKGEGKREGRAPVSKARIEGRGRVNPPNLKTKLRPCIHVILNVQAGRQQPISASEKLIDVVIGQPYEVYESFLEAVKQTRRMDVFEMLVNSGFECLFIVHRLLTIYSKSN